MKQNVDKFEIFSSKKLQDAYCDVTCDDDMGFIGKWMNKNPKIRKYEDMNIYPHPLKCPDNQFNLWTPFKCAAYSGDYVKNDEGLNSILNHLKAMCDNDDVVYDYVVKWIAQLLPPERSGLYAAWGISTHYEETNTSTHQVSSRS